MGWTVWGWNPSRGEVSRIQLDRPWGPSSALYNGYRIIAGGKAVGAWCNQPPLSSAEVKERVELYVYSPSVPSWPFIGWGFSFFPFIIYFIGSPSESNHER